MKTSLLFLFFIVSSLNSALDGLGDIIRQLDYLNSTNIIYDPCTFHGCKQHLNRIKFDSITKDLELTEIESLAKSKSSQIRCYALIELSTNPELDFLPLLEYSILDTNTIIHVGGCRIIKSTVSIFAFEQYRNYLYSKNVKFRKKEARPLIHTIENSKLPSEIKLAHINYITSGIGK